ncbi:MAG: hypothetical protein BWY91_01459 [bacterium ADurb.BinA028]|nr:MAG: hypothetical protein BWY91_01459 [bacterium ADurb.BinA028]
MPVRPVPACVTWICASRRANSSSSSGRPARASRPCCGPSTGWSPTSPAEPSPDRSSSADVTPGRTDREIWPTWSASSCRTRPPPSSPTRSRTRSPTEWRRSASSRPRCAGGSRRPSTSWAWPSCAIAACGSCPEGSSNASPSPPCWPPAHGCWCSTSRPPLWTPWLPKRSCRRCTGSSTTWVTPSSSPSTGWNGSCSTPTGSSWSATASSPRHSTRPRRWLSPPCIRRSSSWVDGWDGHRCR